MIVVLTPKDIIGLGVLVIAVLWYVGIVVISHWQRWQKDK